ncbi:MAG: hypothetical protein MJB14_13480 [Spirochaetes bacterium]|nr:hypothetical protein [Spirochaetota bacterium]
MFIGISFDFISTDTKKQVITLLAQYGINKVHDNLFECFEFPVGRLGNLKRDLTTFLDMDDKLRIYQYPVDNSFKISYIEERKWKRLSFVQ